MWGTFPRVLGHYARELNVINLEMAIHKMTGLSAVTFGIIDRATYDAPARMAVGIEHAFVNGTLAWTLATRPKRQA